MKKSEVASAATGLPPGSAVIIAKARMRNWSTEEKDDAVENSKDPAVLDVLAKDVSGSRKRFVASNPHTCPDTLAELAKSNDWTLRACVIENPRTTDGTLVTMKENEENPKVILALATRYLDDGKDLSDFTEDALGDWKLMETIQDSPNFKPGVVRDAILSGEDGDLGSLTANTTLTREDIEAICKEKGPSYRVNSLLLNHRDKFDDDMLRGLFSSAKQAPQDSASSSILETLARVKDLPDDLINDLVDFAFDDQYRLMDSEIAAHPRLTPEQAARLRKHSDVDVRREIWRNASCSSAEDIVRAYPMMNDDEEAAVISNENAPVDLTNKILKKSGLDPEYVNGAVFRPGPLDESTMMLIANNGEASARDYLLGRDDKTQPVINRIAELALNDSERGVPLVYAAHALTQVDNPVTIERAVNSSSLSMKENISSNPHLLPEQVGALGMDDDAVVRAAVAKRPDLTATQKQQFLTDPDSLIRMAAVENEYIDIDVVMGEMVNEVDDDVLAGISHRLGIG